MSTAIRVRLDHAETLLAGTSSAPAWPRCAAWLTRLALEYALDELWAAHCPQLRQARFQSQLLALRVVADEGLAQRATQLWDVLSRAGHHHFFELEPAASELRRWLVETRAVTAVLQELARPGAARRRPAP